MKGRVTRITVSVTPREKALLTKLADYEGRLSLTATVRHILLEAARDRGILELAENGSQDGTLVGDASST